MEYCPYNNSEDMPFKINIQADAVDITGMASGRINVIKYIFFGMRHSTRATLKLNRLMTDTLIIVNKIVFFSARSNDGFLIRTLYLPKNPASFPESVLIKPSRNG